MNQVVAIDADFEETTNYQFTLIPPLRIPQIWSKVAPLLQPAVDRSHGRWTIENLFDAVYVGQQQLWIGYEDIDEIKFALTSQISDYPNAKFLAVQFLGGDAFADWSDDMLSLLKRFAEDSGCTGIEAVARFGFWPLFKRHGYTRSYVTYELNF